MRPRIEASISGVRAKVASSTTSPSDATRLFCGSRKPSSSQVNVRTVPFARVPSGNTAPGTYAVATRARRRYRHRRPAFWWHAPPPAAGMPHRGSNRKGRRRPPPRQHRARVHLPGRARARTLDVPRSCSHAAANAARCLGRPQASRNRCPLRSWAHRRWRTRRAYGRRPQACEAKVSASAGADLECGDVSRAWSTKAAARCLHPPPRRKRADDFVADSAGIFVHGAQLPQGAQPNARRVASFACFHYTPRLRGAHEIGSGELSNTCRGERV